jgi:thiamine-monophosphate kinase
MIDVSDGVTGDLGHILEMSGVGATVDIDALPRSAVLDRCLAGAARETALACLLSGGDDYELCFTAPIARRDEVVHAAGAAGVTVARIGAITSGSALVLRDASGATLPVPRSFDHFA